MDVYNNLIKNESGDDIISVNDLGYLGEGTHFFKFYTPKYPLPYVITVEGKGADDLEYSIKHLRIDTKYQNISSYRYSTRLYGLDNTKLFFTMQFIANKTFVDDVFSEKPIFKADTNSLKELEDSDIVTEWLELNDDERRAIWIISQIQLLKKDPFKNINSFNTSVGWGIAKFPELGNDLILINTTNSDMLYSLIKNVPETLINKVSSNTTNKKMKTDDSILKDISDDLVKIAMMPKEYRVSGILNLKLLVDDLDEDNIPKEQVDLIKSIVNDLIDEVKNPQVDDEEIEDEEVDLDADICALNDLLDDAFDVDDVDELNDLLNCEVAKIESKSETLSDFLLTQESDLLYRSNEMGYRFLENTEDNEKLIEFNRDFVDEETGDVISVGVNKEKKFLIAKDDAQADRWNDWVLNN